MPSQILHVLFGEDALDRIASASAGSAAGRFASMLAEAVRAGAPSGALFALGCQGPDIFYHNQRRRPLSIEYGTLLHRRGYGSFSASLLRRAFSGRSPGTVPDGPAAYALGFLTHAFLDRAAHPYIVSKSGWVSPSKPETARYARCHAFFERILDVLMLERLRGADAASWDQESRLCSFSDEDAARVVGLIAASLREIFPERAASDAALDRRLANAFLDSAGFYKITNPARTSLNQRLPDGFEYLKKANGRSSVALIYPERFPYGIDYLNLARSSWPHPCDPASFDRRSFPDLYRDAVATAVSALAPAFAHFAETGAVDAGALARAVGGGGLSAAGPDGHSCAPVSADPLPLDAVLDGQYRLRLARIAARG